MEQDITIEEIRLDMTAADFFLAVARTLSKLGVGTSMTPIMIVQSDTGQKVRLEFDVSLINATLVTDGELNERESISNPVLQ